ncbi:ketopantoate reductase family protein [Aspergillus fischeri NRRL 181]|uniref:Ketopantoate reductase, putative n=1 Tax=Neosartorya fischeri (strain ATCC 1020 / DSM 3700 / CBS 544.65 / FGSC A1164 / JCM 1740 / NRRL 181 / WB 181) TaxID=331117 RepID=A1DK68_NEOFI|nr:ketopantoate reductase, putative [Aspergillus fischeri NRRL 181]EAW17107.1 ketopantoate reductase, putative [Aspergillus fischeri NRRL 181]
MTSGFEVISCEHGHLQGWRPTAISNAVPHVAPSEESRFFDYVVCTTKNIPDVGPSVCEIIAPAVTPGLTVIVLLQNGLNIEKPFLSRFPHNVILSGVSQIDAHEIAPGVIEQKGNDHLCISAFRKNQVSEDIQQKATEEFLSIYGAGRRTTIRYEPDWEQKRWRKLVYNATLNPICALTRVNTGDLQICGGALDHLVVPAMQEVVKIARAVGVDLPKDVIETAVRMYPVENKICPSMQKDMQKGNLVEHENLIGEVIREGQRRGIPAPILSVLYELCSAVQWRTRKETEERS